MMFSVVQQLRDIQNDICGPDIVLGHATDEESRVNVLLGPEP
jgi:hypothetical protein